MADALAIEQREFPVRIDVHGYRRSQRKSLGMIDHETVPAHQLDSKWLKRSSPRERLQAILEIAVVHVLAAFMRIVPNGTIRLLF